jgi:ubiquitin-conjugating enzyme E2 S
LDDDLSAVEVTLEGPGTTASMISLTIEQTPFENSIFHLRLQFTAQYPLTPPTVHFITKIFHPNIAPRTGEVCVNTLKRDWNSKVTVTEILMVQAPHVC